MAEALLGNAGPETDEANGGRLYETPRERVPLHVSLERARLWMKGLEAI